jgi:hypothetical protein
MNSYQEFAKHLVQLLGGVHAVRIAVPGFMPLSVEEIGSSDNGHRLVSLCHYGEQNGDLMRDPDLVFMVTDVLPERLSGNSSVFPTLKQDLKEFARAWFATLRDQGFFAPTAVREIVSP